MYQVHGRLAAGQEVVESISRVWRWATPRCLAIGQLDTLIRRPIATAVQAQGTVGRIHCPRINDAARNIQPHSIQSWSVPAA